MVSFSLEWALRSGQWITESDSTVFRNCAVGGMMRWPLWRVSVAERSMEPAVMPGDWLLAWRGACPLRNRSGGGPGGRGGGVKVRPGQLVIARNPAVPSMLVIKRVACREGAGWWLTADNPRAGGVDSFRFGPVQADLIEARVLVRYWPLWRR